MSTFRLKLFSRKPGDPPEIYFANSEVQLHEQVGSLYQINCLNKG